MIIDHSAIASTLPTGVDELMAELDLHHVPVHITAGNRLLRAELGDVDETDLRAAISIRKRQHCGSCKTGDGAHTEPNGARVQEFTPGARSGR